MIIITTNYLEIIRHKERPNAQYYITKLFPDFIEMSGDRLFGDDLSIICGIATINGITVTIIGQQKGRNLEEHIKYNFSMSKPEGYRKVMRLMKQAEKFKRPVICFVDTLGAYPGKEAEERGQGSAIAHCLMNIMYLKTPIISILIGDGGSGGALVLCVSDIIISLEHATLSVIAPKACANILWKDTSKDTVAAAMLKTSARDLKEFEIVNMILPEPDQGAQTNPEKIASDICQYLKKELKTITRIPLKKLVKMRNEKYRNIGQQYIIYE